MAGRRNYARIPGTPSETKHQGCVCEYCGLQSLATCYTKLRLRPCPGYAPGTGHVCERPNLDAYPRKVKSLDAASHGLKA